MDIVQLNNICFAYNNESVLQDINLRVKELDFIGIIGPNGGGKTTLLKIILGLLEPSSGTVLIDGEKPKDAYQSIGYVPQDVHFNTSFPVTAIDVVLMGKIGQKKHFSRRAQAAAQKRDEAMYALEQLNIGQFATRKIGMLSGGQRQRVLIARALVCQPKLLIMDEPVASIDAKGQAEFYLLLKELNKKITILTVSHDLIAISRYIKSVACVNRQLHYHDQAEITNEILNELYPSTDGSPCPIELLGHGLPHRVLSEHEECSHD